MLSSDTWVVMPLTDFNQTRFPKLAPTNHCAVQHSDPGAVAHFAFTIRATAVTASENSGGNPADTSSERKTRPPAFSIFAVLAIQTFALILKA